MQILSLFWNSTAGSIAPPLRDATDKGECLVGQVSAEESGRDLSLRSALDQSPTNDLPIYPYRLNGKHARSAKYLLVLAFVGCLATAMSGQTKDANTRPPSMQQMLIPSHGSMLLGVFYLAAGSEPHPTAVIFHGFPGFEQNLDIAQTLRAHGWNVLAMHYRGSWGVKGEFSFGHAVEDADTQVCYILDPINVRKYLIDTRRVIVIGHSMGGYMAAASAAHNPRIAAAVLISAWNIGADYETRAHLRVDEPATVENEGRGLGRDGGLLPLSGTTGKALAREIHKNTVALNINNLAPSITPRPVLVITTNEADHGFIEALHRAGDANVTELHFDTDHSYSDRRAELSSAVVEWTQSFVQD